MQELNDVVVAGMARSPIGDFMGSLSGIKAVPLAMQVAEEAIRRSGMPKDRIDEVTLGCVYKHGMKGNPARQVQIGLGLPYTGTAVTVEQQCSSSMRALEIAAQQIMLGKTRAALVTGVESMSNVPFMIMDSRKGLKDKTRIEDALYWDALIDVFSGESIIRTAENVAEQYNVTREDQDEYACITQNRAAAAAIMA